MGLIDRIFMGMITLSLILFAAIVTFAKVSQWLGSTGILSYIISGIVLLIIGIPIAILAGKSLTNFLGNIGSSKDDGISLEDLKD